MKKFFLLILFLLIPSIAYARGWEPTGLIGILLLLWACIVFLLTLFIFLTFQLKRKNIKNIVLIFFLSLNITIISWLFSTIITSIFIYIFNSVYIVDYILPIFLLIPFFLSFKFKNKYLSIIEKQKYPLFFQIMIFFIFLFIFFILFWRDFIIFVKNIL